MYIMSAFENAYIDSMLKLKEMVDEWSDAKGDDHPSILRMRECIKNIVFYVNDLEIRDIKRKEMVKSLEKWSK